LLKHNPGLNNISKIDYSDKNNLRFLLKRRYRSLIDALGIRTSEREYG
jgi:hypothetical protein